jgi:hypothetical protein
MAMISLAVEVVGLILVGIADARWWRKSGIPDRSGFLAGLPGAGRGGGQSGAAA